MGKNHGGIHEESNGHMRSHNDVRGDDHLIRDILECRYSNPLKVFCTINELVDAIKNRDIGCRAHLELNEQ